MNFCDGELILEIMSPTDQLPLNLMESCERVTNNLNDKLGDVLPPSLKKLIKDKRT